MLLMKHLIAHRYTSLFINPSLFLLLLTLKEIEDSLALLGMAIVPVKYANINRAVTLVESMFYTSFTSSLY